MQGVGDGCQIGSELEDQTVTQWCYHWTHLGRARFHIPVPSFSSDPVICKNLCGEGFEALGKNNWKDEMALTRMWKVAVESFQGIEMNVSVHKLCLRPQEDVGVKISRSRVEQSDWSTCSSEVWHAHISPEHCGQ